MLDERVRISVYIVRIFDLFHFELDEVHSLKQQVGKKRTVQLLRLLIPDAVKEIFHGVGYRRDIVVQHHGGGAFDRMHEPEYFIDRILLKALRLFTFQY